MYALPGRAITGYGQTRSCRDMSDLAAGVATRNGRKLPQRVEPPGLPAFTLYNAAVAGTACREWNC